MIEAILELKASCYYQRLTLLHPQGMRVRASGSIGTNLELSSLSRESIFIMGATALFVTSDTYIKLNL